MNRLCCFLLFAAMLVAASTWAQDWGAVANVSATMGVSGHRLCYGETSRGDIGCPADAPMVGGSTITGTFAGDGSGLTGVTAASADRIVSGIAQVIANGNSNSISITEAGVTTGYYYGGVWVAGGACTTGGISGSTGYFSNPVGMGTIASASSMLTISSSGLTGSCKILRLGIIIMHRPMPEGVRLSAEIPDQVKLALADAVITFGRIEQELIEIAWVLSNADLEQRVKIARQPTSDNFIKIIEAVEKAEPGLELHALKSAIRQLADDRNLMVHGAWTMTDDKPWVVWHKFAEDTDSVIGEHFEPWRFERFMTKGLHILGTLRESHNMLEAQTGVKTTAIPRKEAL